MRIIRHREWNEDIIQNGVDRLVFPFKSRDTLHISLLRRLDCLFCFSAAKGIRLVGNCKSSRRTLKRWHKIARAYSLAVYETAQNRQATPASGVTTYDSSVFHIVSVRNASLFLDKESSFLMRKWAKQEKRQKQVVKLLILVLAVVIISNVIIYAVMNF